MSSLVLSNFILFTTKSQLVGTFAQYNHNSRGIFTEFTFLAITQVQWINHNVNNTTFFLQTTINSKIKTKLSQRE
uniref:Putative secreted protein n=1 Tax=Lutzomyia longipalpis TaxID=7200 RepID=A0A7G3ALX4_LUTLO